MISAIVLINAEVHRIPEVAEAIVEIDGVQEVYSVTGDIDLIAVVHAGQHDRCLACRIACRRHHRGPPQ